MENQTKIQQTLDAIQPNILGHRWDAEENTLFLISTEEMETEEFSTASLTRYIMEGVEGFLSFHNTPSYSYHRGN